jgi:hypothetical protein
MPETQEEWDALTEAEKIALIEESIKGKPLQAGLGPTPDGLQKPVLFENNEEPLSGEFFAAGVTTHVVQVRIAADEEYRFWMSNWQSITNGIIEQADNSMYDKFGIDNQTSDYVSWDSQDNKNLCINVAGNGTLRNELLWEVPTLGSDIVAGYSKQWPGGDPGPPATAGCAFLDGTHFVQAHQGGAADWQATQHEESHLFGAPDRPASHPNDVMENPYSWPNVWDIDPAWNDYGIMTSNADKYD